MTERLSSERGITLPEVLVTMVIALVLSLATFALVDVTIRRTGEISARSDGVQRGRVAMDLMTRQLRSQVCIGATTPSSRSIIAGSATSVTFYAELGDPSTPNSSAGPSATPQPRVVEIRNLKLETAGSYAPGTLVERRYVGTPSTSDPLGFVFPSMENPTSTRELMRPVALTPTPNRPAETPALFRFYGWNTADPRDPRPTTQLPFATPDVNDASVMWLSDDDVKKVARIEITYRSKPRKNNVSSTVFFNDVTLRTVDPNSPTGELNVPCL